MVREPDEPGRADRTIAVLHFGGLGDVVLLSECVARWKRAEPATRVIIFCRSPFASATRAFGVLADRVVPVDVDPYGVVPVGDDGLAVARAAFTDVEEPIDELLCAELRPTWLSWIAIECLRPSSAGITTVAPPAWLSGRLALSPETAIEPFAAGEDGARSLIAAISPPSVEAASPVLTVDASLRESARASLARDESRRLIAVVPFAEPRVPYKRWPFERFVRLVGEIARDDDVLLFGARDEEPELCRLRDAVAAPERVFVFAGDENELPRCFALLSLADAFVGNDTGLAHAAAALGRPGVAIYGGGFWPAYRPWAAGTIGLVAPLPCFGCAWDCAFDRGLCVEAVPLESVTAALAEALTAPFEPARVVERDAPAPGEATILAAAASAHARVRERHRADLAERDDRLAGIESAANERLRALVAASERNDEVEGALAFDRAQELETEREVTRLHHRVVELESVASERLAAIESISEEARRVRLEAEKRSVLIAELSAIVESQHGQMEGAQRRIAELTADAEKPRR